LSPCRAELKSARSSNSISSSSSQQQPVAAAVKNQLLRGARKHQLSLIKNRNCAGSRQPNSHLRLPSSCPPARSMIFCDPPARYILEIMRPTSAAPQMPIWTGTTATRPMTTCFVKSRKDTSILPEWPPAAVKMTAALRLSQAPWGLLLRSLYDQSNGKQAQHAQCFA